MAVRYQGRSNELGVPNQAFAQRAEERPAHRADVKMQRNEESPKFEEQKLLVPWDEIDIAVPLVA